MAAPVCSLLPRVLITSLTGTGARVLPYTTMETYSSTVVVCASKMFASQRMSSAASRVIFPSNLLSSKQNLKICTFFVATFSHMQQPHYKPKNHWGHHLWSYIHTICVLDSEECCGNENLGRQFVASLKALLHVIPCDICADMYSKHLPELDTLDLTKPMVLFDWSWRVHNMVNKKLGKPDIPYEVAVEKWTILI